MPFAFKSKKHKCLNGKTIRFACFMVAAADRVLPSFSFLPTGQAGSSNVSSLGSIPTCRPRLHGDVAHVPRQPHALGVVHSSRPRNSGKSSKRNQLREHGTPRLSLAARSTRHGGLGAAARATPPPPCRQRRRPPAAPPPHAPATRAPPAPAPTLAAGREGVLRRRRGHERRGEALGSGGGRGG
jgi:hypothetical protein